MASTEEGCQEFGTLDLDILGWNHCSTLTWIFQMLLMIAMHEVSFIFYAGIPLKIIFVRIFYYLLTQPFDTKETTIFSLLHTALHPFLLLSFAVSIKDFYCWHWHGCASRRKNSLLPNKTCNLNRNQSNITQNLAVQLRFEFVQQPNFNLLINWLILFDLIVDSVRLKSSGQAPPSCQLNI